MLPSSNRNLRYPSRDECGTAYLGNGHGASNATDVLRSGTARIDATLHEHD